MRLTLGVSGRGRATLTMACAPTRNARTRSAARRGWTAGPTGSSADRDQFELWVRESTWPPHQTLPAREKRCPTWRRVPDRLLPHQYWLRFPERRAPASRSCHNGCLGSSLECLSTLKPAPADLAQPPTPGHECDFPTVPLPTTRVPPDLTGTATPGTEPRAPCESAGRSHLATSTQRSTTDHLELFPLLAF
jgi:hypothetical protein